MEPTDNKKPVYIRLVLRNSDKEFRNWLILTAKKKGLGLLTFVRMIVKERYEQETGNKKP